MTPEEKAKELFQKMLNHPDYYSRSAINGMTTYMAKQCALIAVDEILQVVSSDESAIIVELQYWEQVKEAIQAL